MNQATRNVERHLAVYNQNSEHFRSLNSQMWQIPIIGMTLTGGLWFGVSNVKASPIFQVVLLLLAVVGNVALIIILMRLRFVMGAYLEWLNQNEPAGRINADGSRFWEQSHVVRTTFQIVLGLAALCSALLLIPIADAWSTASDDKLKGNIAEFYDSYASVLADEYSMPTFAQTHPYLASHLRQARPLSILDIGPTAVRDANQMTMMGHRVIVGLPSTELISLASADGAKRQPAVPLTLPELANISRAQRFDLIVFSSVWTHVAPGQRQRLTDRLLGLLRPGGQLYLTFREGPPDPHKLIYPSSVTEVRRLIAGTEAKVEELPFQPDPLGRKKYLWRTVLVQMPSA